jgi:hypothetical protein
MSALNEIDVNKLHGLTGLQLRFAIGTEFWNWYNLHKNDAVVQINVWLIHKTFRVCDVRSLFERLFGPEPVAP